MSEKTRSIFVKLGESEADQVRALAREFGLPMEEICSRLIIHALEELAAEARAAEDLPAGERQRLAYEAAVREVEKWEPEF